MCGSVKLEGRKDFTRIRSIIPAEFFLENSHNNTGYMWDGFARVDGSVDKVKTMIEQWPSEIWVPEILKIESFTERNRKTRKTREMRARRIGVITSANGYMKVITRPSRTPDEISIHHRMPLRVPAIMTRNQFINDLNRLTLGNYH